MLLTDDDRHRPFTRETAHWILGLMLLVAYPKRLVEAEDELISVCSGGDVIVWKKLEKEVLFNSLPISV